LAQANGAFIASAASMPGTRAHFRRMKPGFHTGIVTDIIKLVDVDHLNFIVAFLDACFSQFRRWPAI
jgi:hypothetical protein